MTEFKIKRRGGARPGSGRKPGSPNKIHAPKLLEAIERQAAGSYEEILVADFLEARKRKDYNLVQRYHNLILNKVMGTRQQVEVELHTDVTAKQAAFQAALAELTRA
jgi:hypothetical protein